MKALVFLLISVVLSQPATAQVLFQDGFENGFAPQWYGRFDVFSITEAQAHSGTHAATTNGRWHWLAVDLGTNQHDTTFECWFHDSGTSIEEPIMGVSQTDPCCGSQNILWLGLETFFDPARYMWGRGFEEISTSIPRITGWHKVTFRALGPVTRLFLDNQFITETDFQTGWRYIVIWENSKFPEPHTMNFWDDVVVQIGEPVAVEATTWGSIKAQYE